MANNLFEEEKYFGSYAYPGIHEEMIKDNVRTRSYRSAILNNKHLFKNKIVLDVGCGTGILSMFAAKAGAKHVYAVDKSAVINQAREIIKLNQLDDVITLFHNTVEETELPVERVDIIISEWMGYCLLYESMLDSVIFARDKWLADGGHIFPDVASLHMCAIEDEELREDKMNWWSSVYGFNMSPMREVALSEPIVDYVPKDLIISEQVMVKTIDLYSIKVEDLKSIKFSFELKLLRNDFLHAIVAYFSVEFNACHKPIKFFTGPLNCNTHWKQTVFYLSEPIPVKRNQTIFGIASFKQNIKHKRHLDIELSLFDDAKRENLLSTRKYHLG